LCGRRRRGGGPGSRAAQALHFLLKLLVAILQFLDRAGELAHLRLQAVDARDEVGARHLRVRGAGPQRARHDEQGS
jgi:hypothetical protein